MSIALNSRELEILKVVVNTAYRYMTLSLPVCRIYEGGTSNYVYFYKSTDEGTPYSVKHNYAPGILTDVEFDKLHRALVKLTANTKFYICRETKKFNAIRMRHDLKNAFDLAHEFSELENRLKIEEERTQAPSPVTVTPVEQERKDNKKMNDFSLTNLKNALVNKVTHLDKKTVTILAIIALLLLIVGKYQTIKDIFKGIVDKVKRSKNFKAMVEDGTNAINGLKKIVGVKSTDKGDN